MWAVVKVPNCARRRVYLPLVKTILGALLAALVLPLAGCGGGSSSGSAVPVFVEPATCRDRLATFLDITDENGQNGLDYDTFHGRVEQLNRTSDHALSTCSEQVVKPVRKGLYHYAVADATWLACSFGSFCLRDKVSRHILGAQADFMQARRLVERKS
jgi:hypothetical protein